MWNEKKKLDIIHCIFLKRKLHPELCMFTHWVLCSVISCFAEEQQTQRVPRFVSEKCPTPVSTCCLLSAQHQRAHSNYSRGLSSSGTNVHKNTKRKERPPAGLDHCLHHICKLPVLDANFHPAFL